MAFRQLNRVSRTGSSSASTVHPHTQGGHSSAALTNANRPALPRRTPHAADDQILALANADRHHNSGALPRGGLAGPLRVFAPSREEVVTSSTATETSTSSSSEDLDRQVDLDSLSSIAVEPSVSAAVPASVSVSHITAPVAEDMRIMNENLRNVVGQRHPMLMAAADQIFGAGGKKLRPVIVFLVARATAEHAGLSDLTDKHRRLAEITEMIHTASLVHDDVVDECDTRRGQWTVNRKYGTRIAVLTGDFLFAQSSWFLANLDNLEVIKLISQVISDFANGEISQASSLFDTDTSLDQYLDKSFYKTASLIAASCKSSAVFSSVSLEVKDAMFEYGRHLGLAFQVVDDILDFTQTSEQLGKPQGQDLASGNLTAPVLFALRNEFVGAELLELIETEFCEEGSLPRALELVQLGGGIGAARQLARREADLALQSLSCLGDSPSKRSLEMMVDYVLDRLY